MIDIALNGGDLLVTECGDIMLNLSDDDNIIQTANSAINTIKGENIFHPEYGNDAWNMRLKASETGFEMIEACVQEAILDASDEIDDVVSIEATKGDTYGDCIIDYMLLTVDGRNISSSTSINIL